MEKAPARGTPWPAPRLGVISLTRIFTCTVRIHALPNGVIAQFKKFPELKVPDSKI